MPTSTPPSVFKQTEADASKLKTYCEVTKTMDTAGDKEDAATDAKIDGYLKQLGPVRLRGIQARA